jgi:hypothetical protein
VALQTYAFPSSQDESRQHGRYDIGESIAVLDPEPIWTLRKPVLARNPTLFNTHASQNIDSIILGPYKRYILNYSKWNVLRSRDSAVGIATG